MANSSAVTDAFTTASHSSAVTESHHLPTTQQSTNTVSTSHSSAVTESSPCGTTSNSSAVTESYQAPLTQHASKPTSSDSIAVTASDTVTQLSSNIAENTVCFIFDRRSAELDILTKWRHANQASCNFQERLSNQLRKLNKIAKVNLSDMTIQKLRGAIR